MGFQCGIVGLPNVGKSTLFNALTAAGAAAANYPFCTIDPNIGVAPVPDERLDKLASLFKPEKVTPTTIEFVDIAGLVKGASQGEGLGNQFLGNIRNVDAICHVVRCFKDANVVHVSATLKPLADLETIETELMLADLEMIERRLQKVEKTAKTGDKSSQEILPTLKKVHEALSQGRDVKALVLDEKEQGHLAELTLLTGKPAFIAANIDEMSFTKPSEELKAVQEYSQKKGLPLVMMCAKLEAEIAELNPAERSDYIKAAGISEAGLNQIVRQGYSILNLITYFTAGPKEVRAWTITQGTKAPQAAGKIHSDFEKGFIKAEICHYNDMIAAGSYPKVQERGLLRIEGKDYTVVDGDIVHFRFNV